jgi:hypothetical protein
VIKPFKNCFISSNFDAINEIGKFLAFFIFCYFLDRVLPIFKYFISFPRFLVVIFILFYLINLPQVSKTSPRCGIKWHAVARSGTQWHAVARSGMQSHAVPCNARQCLMQWLMKQLIPSGCTGFIGQ